MPISYRRPGAMLFWLVLLTIMFLLMAEPSAAQQLLTLDEINAAAGDRHTDKSRQILYSLLGPFGDNPFTAVSEATHLLGQLFFIFNSVLFVVGISFIIYKMVMAVAESAHEGEVLGKRMSGLWIPIRFGTGTFGMLPVFAGFSLAQAIMMFIAIIGIGLANLLTTAAVTANAEFDALIPPPGIAVSKHSPTITPEVAHALFAMNVCRLGVNDFYSKQTGVRASYVDVHTTNSGGIYARGRGVDCGGVDVTVNEDVFRLQESGGFRNPAVQYDQIKEVARVVYQQRRTALNTLQLSVVTLADTWYRESILNKTIQPYPTATLIQAANTAHDAEHAAVRERLHELAESSKGVVSDEIKESMNEKGWTSIGAWYSTFAESNSAIQSATMATAIEIRHVDFEKIKLPQTVIDALIKLGVQKEKSDESCKLYVVVPGSVNAVGACTVGQSILLDFVDAVVGDTGGEGMINPIIASKNIGDWLLVGVGTILVIKPIMDGASWVVSKTPLGRVIKPITAKAGKLFGALTDIDPNSFGGKLASALFLGALVTGLVYAVYIPFIPFLTWFSGLVSYFASVIEGLVAAQVWAFSHLNSDGDGMGQKAEKGYLYILNMLLRPGLMVLGFFFASGIITLLGTFFFAQFGTALANVQGDTNTGPFIFVGALMVIMLVLVTTIQTVFNLIYEVPDRVIAWFGHGMEARLASNMDSKLEHKTDAAAKWGGATLMSGTGRPQ